MISQKQGNKKKME